MSNNARHVIEIVFFVVINGVFSIAGSAANVVNIIVFIKQGFNDSINISLCGLAIADLGNLLPVMWKSICYNPLFLNSNIEMDSVQVQYLTAGIPHRCFVSITNWITAFITFEKCVCISHPLKVREIITPTRTFISIAAIFLIMFATVAPVFSSAGIAKSFNSQSNKSLYRLSYTNVGREVQTVTHYNITFQQLISFVIVGVSTTMLVYNLFTKSIWRNTNMPVSAFNNSDSKLSRETRVMKMVTCISCIFIFCYMPNTVILIIFEHSPDYSSGGRYENVYRITWTILSTLEVVNSSATIFVYYTMSSRYRTTLNKLFQTQQTDEQTKAV